MVKNLIMNSSRFTDMASVQLPSSLILVLLYTASCSAEFVWFLTENPSAIKGPGDGVLSRSSLGAATKTPEESRTPPDINPEKTSQPSEKSRTDTTPAAPSPTNDREPRFV